MDLKTDLRFLLEEIIKVRILNIEFQKMYYVRDVDLKYPEEKRFLFSDVLPLDGIIGDVILEPIEDEVFSYRASIEFEGYTLYSHLYQYEVDEFYKKKGEEQCGKNN